eukprot:GHVR01134992.1.p2 GENE.GHVR01134992.1~~GHVR01134992.1.p2  ORF type:complete len:173 (+),score=24.61 GHVR01134992.1:750-1268(+)
MISFVVFMSATRFILIQISGVKHTSMQLLLLTQPMCLLILLPLAYLFELDKATTQLQFLYIHNYNTFINVIFLIFFSSAVAFVVNFANFFMVQQTSSLTITIVGQIKLLCTILMGELSFKERVPLGNWITMIACCVGLVAYSHIRTTTKQQQKENQQDEHTHTQVQSACKAV